MKRKEAESFSSVLEQALAGAPLEAPVMARSALETFYFLTEPVFRGEPRGDDDEIRDGILYVRVSSFPLRSELNMRRSLIIREINRRLGAEVVTRIRFR